MKVNLIGKEGSYCGSIRSYSHNEITDETTIVFTGSIVKRFKDTKKLGIDSLSKFDELGVRRITLNVLSQVYNGYSKDSND